MITSHGAKCDVCGDYILFDNSINPFSVKGIDRECHCHDKCKELVLVANGDWHALPNGPIRQAFEREVQRREINP